MSYDEKTGNECFPSVVSGTGNDLLEDTMCMDIPEHSLSHEQSTGMQNHPAGGDHRSGHS